MIMTAPEIKKSELAVMRIDGWANNLPYGAMLAMKEAKEKGLVNFHIYYPINQFRQREKTDPVIVGYSGVRMYEIFAWDDGKVYECGGR